MLNLRCNRCEDKEQLEDDVERGDE